MPTTQRRVEAGGKHLVDLGGRSEHDGRDGASLCDEGPVVLALHIPEVHGAEHISSHNQTALSGQSTHMPEVLNMLLVVRGAAHLAETLFAGNKTVGPIIKYNKQPTHFHTQRRTAGEYPQHSLR